MQRKAVKRWEDKNRRQSNVGRKEENRKMNEKGDVEEKAFLEGDRQEATR